LNRHKDISINYQLSHYAKKVLNFQFLKIPAF